MTVQTPPETQGTQIAPPIVAPHPALPPSTVRRNYQLGVANGVLFTLDDSFTSAGLALVGLLPALQSGGFLLPQLLVGGRLQAMTYKLPLYRRAAVVRLSTFLILALVVFAAAVIPPDLSLWLIIICYMVFNLGGGTSTLAFQDVVAKIIPARRRGSFFGTRQLMGGLLTFAMAGPLVRWLLGVAGPLPFPHNFRAGEHHAWARDIPAGAGRLAGRAARLRRHLRGRAELRAAGAGRVAAADRGRRGAGAASAAARALRRGLEHRPRIRE